MLHKKSKRTNLHYIHPKVDLDDLQSNGKFYSEQMIQLIKEGLKNLPDGRFSKEKLKHYVFIATGKKIDFPFGIVKSNDHFYAVYKGFEQGKHLGRGTYGVTKLGQDLETGLHTALKFISLGHIDDPLTKTTIRNLVKDEISQLDKLNLLETSVATTSKTKGEQKIIGMKFAEGEELWNLVDPGNAYDQFNPLQRFMMAKSLLKSTKDAHAQGVLHRDIKPDNFVCDPGTCQVRLIDYGLAKDVDKEQKKPPQVSQHQKKEGASKKKEISAEDEVSLGTPPYMAPEIVKSKYDPTPRVYNEATEVYALGMTIADIFDLTKPAAKLLGYHRMKIVETDDPKYLRNPRLPKDPNSRKELLELVQAMTHDDPSKRPKIAVAYSKINELLRTEFDKPFKVGIIQMEQFAGLNDKQKTDLIYEITKKMRLEGITSIALGQSTQGEPDVKLALEIRSLLAKRYFLNVVPVIFSGEKKALQQDAAEYFTSHFQAKPTFYEITKKVKKISITLPPLVAAEKSPPSPSANTQKTTSVPPEKDKPVQTNNEALAVKTSTGTTVSALEKNARGPVTPPQMAKKEPGEVWVKTTRVPLDPTPKKDFLSGGQRSPLLFRSSVELYAETQKRVEELPIYRGKIDSNGAKALLRAESPGAFLVRFSPNPIHNNYYLTVKINDSQVISFEIKKNELTDLVTNNGAELKTRVATKLGEDRYKVTLHEMAPPQKIVANVK